ncbi:hypothetical protein VP01_1089g2 [Puccinia sorghi]|uniref:Uncharacterized protein n=1 Tax=Puccinia sorghi TaxID=27349 RepID=A0A0L6VT45_9BASI|nr:hypothetical protein VP01_1089g2 [Puccinia sorghi]
MKVRVIKDADGVAQKKVASVGKDSKKLLLKGNEVHILCISSNYPGEDLGLAVQSLFESLALTPHISLLITHHHTSHIITHHHTSSHIITHHHKSSHINHNHYLSTPTSVQHPLSSTMRALDSKISLRSSKNIYPQPFFQNIPFKVSYLIDQFLEHSDSQKKFLEVKNKCVGERLNNRQSQTGLDEAQGASKTPQNVTLITRYRSVNIPETWQKCWISFSPALHQGDSALWGGETLTWHLKHPTNLTCTKTARPKPGSSYILPRNQHCSVPPVTHQQEPQNSSFFLLFFLIPISLDTIQTKPLKSSRTDHRIHLLKFCVHFAPPVEGIILGIRGRLTKLIPAVDHIIKNLKKYLIFALKKTAPIFSMIQIGKEGLQLHRLCFSQIFYTLIHFTCCFPQHPKSFYKFPTNPNQPALPTPPCNGIWDVFSRGSGWNSRLDFHTILYLALAINESQEPPQTTKSNLLWFHIYFSYFSLIIRIYTQICLYKTSHVIYFYFHIFCTKCHVGNTVGKLHMITALQEVLEASRMHATRIFHFTA